MDLQGRYRLDRIVGVGATAEVWRGEDLLLHRPVAVRLLRCDRLAYLETFLAAGRAAARLGHRSAVAVYDVGVAELADRGPSPFVVMERIPLAVAPGGPVGVWLAVAVGGAVGLGVDRAVGLGVGPAVPVRRLIGTLGSGRIAVYDE